MAAGSLPPESPFAPSTPNITDHAAEQWDKRTAVWSVSPERAWHEATPIDPHAGRGTDEYRVHEEQGVVFAREGEDVYTVFDAAGPDAEPWLQSLVYAAVGAIWMDAPVDDRPGGDQA